MTARHAAARGRGVRPNRNAGAVAIAVLLIVTGMAICLYPMAANLLAERTHATAITGYRAAVSQMDDVAMRREQSAADRYNQALAAGEVPADDAYEATLNLGSDGVMGYVTVPRIGLRLPIYHGTGETALAKGAGHVRRSSLPVGGTDTHAILTGHRGLPSAELFTRLDELAPGDRFTVTVLQHTLTYRVIRTRVVLPREASVLGIEHGRDLVTLVTCTPYGINTHRLLVTGERVAATPGEDLRQDALAAGSGPWRFGAWTVMAGVGAIAAIGAMIGTTITRTITQHNRRRTHSRHGHGRNGVRRTGTGHGRRSAKPRLHLSTRRTP